MIKTIIAIGLWAIFGWICAAWLGPHTGWGLFAFGLVCMILVSGWQLSRIQRWIKNIKEPPPPSVCPWDEILAPVYRQLRKDQQEITALNQHVDSNMLAAEALHDGDITLDESMLLSWCNQTASEHIGLDLQVDRHRSIFTILRTPEFAR